MKNQTIAKFIYTQITKGWPDTPLLNHDKSWCQVPTEDELSFWIQQHRLSHCAGHSEWSEKFKKNMWVKDD
tara:strand:+ start:719 stop:931 length:213 start_codon:yes stop_codon:yes gene_type:complete